MKIQRISSYDTYCRQNKQQELPQAQTHSYHPSPFKEGLKTAGVWLGFGVALDMVCRKCVVFKNSPTKNSLFVNSLLALIAGSYTAIKTAHSHDFKAN